MALASNKDDFLTKTVADHTLIARVITQATLIEHLINAYISEYYTRCPNGDYQAIYLAYLYDVMNERGLSVDTKINILAKVYKRMLGDNGKLNRTLFINWLKIRNIFAHGVYIVDQGILYGGEFYNINEQADKHANLQIKINLELERLSVLRGPYFNQFPTKK